jgi:hypothetical protein
VGGLAFVGWLKKWWTSSLLRCLMLLKKSRNGVTRPRFTDGYRVESGSESAGSEAQQAFNALAPRGALAGNTPYERLKQKTQDPLS